MGKIVFRLDDIQEGWLESSQAEIINVFSNYPHKVGLSIGIIGSHFGGNSYLLLNAINNFAHTRGNTLEIVCHSFNHENYAKFSFDWQSQNINQFTSHLKTIFPLQIVKSFIPPYNKYNADTLAALEKEKYEIISSSIYEPQTTSTSIASFPAGASTGGWKDNLVLQTSDYVFVEIEKQINKHDWSVVMMHPQEFTLNNLPNSNAIKMLNDLIAKCLDEGHEIVTFKDLNNFYSGK